MTVEAVLPHTRSTAHGGWAIESLSRDGSHVRTVRVDETIHLCVTDRGTTRPAVTQVVLHPDGGVDVELVCAPPVLLVCSDGGRLVPATPDGHGAMVLGHGDLVLVCSADVLDTLPTGVAGVLDWPVREMSMPTVLARLMQDNPSGAVALVRRGTDTREDS